MRIIKAKTYEEMSLAAADYIMAQILWKQDSVLGLATGSTPIGVYNELAERNRQRRLDFAQVRTVNLDEYVGLTADHPQSYARFMRENLFDHLNIKPENTHIPNGVATNIDAECAAYDALIQGLGGVDLQLLGVGHNGHIGFNEPDAAFPLGTHQVTLTESTLQANQRFFERPEDVPTKALTMGIRDIMQAKRVVIVASGSDKAAAVKDMLAGPIVPQMPASILQIHPNCVLFADEAALSQM